MELYGHAFILAAIGAGRSSSSRAMNSSVPALTGGSGIQIYSGLLLAILDTVIAHGDWQNLLGLALIAAALLIRIRIEERWMTQEFGEAYTQYRTRSAALIPEIY